MNWRPKKLTLTNSRLGSSIYIRASQQQVSLIINPGRAEERATMQPPKPFHEVPVVFVYTSVSSSLFHY